MSCWKVEAAHLMRQIWKKAGKKLVTSAAAASDQAKKVSSSAIIEVSNNISRRNQDNNLRRTRMRKTILSESLCEAIECCSNGDKSNK